MTSKQRAYLKGLAMTMEPILQVGKMQHHAGAYRCCSRGT